MDNTASSTAGDRQTSIRAWRFCDVSLCHRCRVSGRAWHAARARPGGRKKDGWRMPAR